MNAFGQPIGEPVDGWHPPPAPARITLQGRWCRVEPLEVSRHGHALFDSNAAGDGRNWTYLFAEPPASREAYLEYLQSSFSGDDPLAYAIVDQATGVAVGLATYLRIVPSLGNIEVGHINFSPALQRTPLATEAMYLMAKYVFDLGYRRYEWKCDSLNAPSRAAAMRFGFSYEGLFRQAVVYKGRNRDTAWYAMIDRDWPALQAAYSAWLAPGSFDSDGTQRVSLRSLTAPLLHAVG